jgi:unsaturated rhamnogalacturonyl hydrolase
MNSWSARMADSVIRSYSLADAEWHYEHGLVVRAIAQVGEAASDERYTRFADDWVDHFITPKGEIRTYCLEDYNLDQINPGNLIFSSYQRSGKKRYRQALQLLRRQLKEQPRTASGGFWHKKIYPDQMWLDGIYMAAPFYARYATLFDEPEGLDDITAQILLIEQHTRDPKTGLLYHAWDESRKQPWADPVTGCSPHFWGRGGGWYVMALVDVLEILPKDHRDYSMLISVLERTARALLKVQDENTGLWYQVLDRAGQNGNYRESSASAMLAYALAKGVRKGYLSPEYLSAARRAYHGLLENRIKVDPQGLLTLEGTCGSAGLGGDPYRDGSYAYYVSEKTVTNDFKGIGPFILAALEIEAAGVELQHVE